MSAPVSAPGPGELGLCGAGEAAWHRLALAALELPSYESDGVWWRRDDASPYLLAAVTVTPGATLPQGADGVAPGRVRDTFGDLVLPGWTARQVGIWMLRPPGPLPDTHVDGLEIDTAVNPDEVWVFERTAVRAAGGDGALEGVRPFSIHGRESGQVPGLRLLLARVGGQPVGTAVAARWRGGVCVTGVAVTEEQRGRGIGSALGAAAVRCAPDGPATLCATAAGRPVYARLGFDDVGPAVDREPAELPALG